MALSRKICIICAWRESCLKRFSITPSAALHCPDFTRDVTIKIKEEDIELIRKKEKEEKKEN